MWFVPRNITYSIVLSLYKHSLYFDTYYTPWMGSTYYIDLVYLYHGIEMARFETMESTNLRREPCGEKYCITMNHGTEMTINQWQLALFPFSWTVHHSLIRIPVASIIVLYNMWRVNSPYFSRGRLHNAMPKVIFFFFKFNTYHAAGVSRRQVQNLTIFVKYFKIVAFHDHIWNYHEKCIQISTNMPSIGLVIPEITCEM